MIVESNVYPRVYEDVVRAVIAGESGLPGRVESHLGYSPERINPGHDMHMLERLKLDGTYRPAGSCTP